MDIIFFTRLSPLSSYSNIAIDYEICLSKKGWKWLMPSFDHLPPDPPATGRSGVLILIKEEKQM